MSTESPFKLEELFISRTDHRGMILSANSVFQRVSEFPWEELLNKPHRIIRHPVTPRGVFYLFWEMLKRKEEVASYVINQSKEGKYYWVFAIATPLDDGGYISVRLKPTSHYFEAIKSYYESYSKEEKEKKIEPSESAKNVLEAIKALGFSSYEEFMTEALLEEVSSRSIKLGTNTHFVVESLRNILAQGEKLKDKCDEISKIYYANTYIPLNLEIKASNLGQEAASISVVSTQYDHISKLIQKAVESFKEVSMSIYKKIESSQFDICASLLHMEMGTFFSQEPKDLPIDVEYESQLVKGMALSRYEKTKETLKTIEDDIRAFKKIQENLKKESLPLEIISITGRIEASKISKGNELTDLLNDLNSFRETLKKEIYNIENLGIELEKEINFLKENIAA